ncbi:MAG: hydrogenase 4 subunit F [Candidatus Omnitrophica bacterium]|nr:hydrogenase 4 subunit F [Candidatus Omnitrophota bacterium]
MLLFLIVIIPVLGAVLSVLLPVRVRGIANLAAHGGVFVLATVLAYHFSVGNGVLVFGGVLRADALSAFFVFLISLVNLAALVYSRPYLREDVFAGVLSEKQVRGYDILFNVFAATMLVVPLLDSLGHMWVAVELTTLASAFLVGFYNSKSSVEAAWKYVIICSVGITLALLGTVLVYHAVAAQTGLKTLDWSVIIVQAPGLDPRVIGAAFLFILVGYGTKAGLAPMHTWLPDAHSQALTPVSALLSGVLLKTSLYAIIRFAMITQKAMGADFTSRLFIFFGLFSVAVAGIFLLAQKDFKRLLAYSSIEHVGIIVFALGVGTPLAVFGALFHALNHAMSKSLIFFAAGNAVKRYKTHHLHMIHGLVRAMPFTAGAALVGLLSLVGMPPFGIFMSKLLILTACFQKGLYGPAALLLFFLAVVFGGLMFHLGPSIFGKKPKGVVSGGEAFSMKLVFVVLALFLVFLGVVMPTPLRALLEAASRTITGVGI